MWQPQSSKSTIKVIRNYNFVVQINKHKSVKHVPHDVVDQGLEISWGISDSGGGNERQRITVLNGDFFFLIHLFFLKNWSEMDASFRQVKQFPFLGQFPLPSQCKWYGTKPQQSQGEWQVRLSHVVKLKSSTISLLERSMVTGRVWCKIVPRVLGSGKEWQNILCEPPPIRQWRHQYRSWSGLPECRDQQEAEVWLVSGASVAGEDVLMDSLVSPH